MANSKEDNDELESEDLCHPGDHNVYDENHPDCQSGCDEFELCGELVNLKKRIGVSSYNSLEKDAKLSAGMDFEALLGEVGANLKKQNASKEDIDAKFSDMRKEHGIEFFNKVGRIILRTKKSIVKNIDEKDKKMDKSDKKTTKELVKKDKTEKTEKNVKKNKIVKKNKTKKTEKNVKKNKIVKKNKTKKIEKTVKKDKIVKKDKTDKKIKKGIGAWIVSQLKQSKDMSKVDNVNLASKARDKFDSNTKPSCVSWYKNKIKKGVM